MKAKLIFGLAVAFAGTSLWSMATAADKGASPNARNGDGKSTGTPNVDWNEWGGSPARNNTPVGHNIPTEWNIGEFDYRTGDWDKVCAWFGYESTKFRASTGSARPGT